MPAAADLLAGLGRAVRPLTLPFSLFTTAKSFKANPLIGNRFLNRLGLHAARAALAHGVMAVRSRAFAVGVPQADRAAYFRDGILAKPDFLPTEVFARVRQEVEAYRGPVREFQEGEAITRRILFDDGDMAALGGTMALEDYQPLARLMAMASGGAPPVWSVECVLHGADDPQTVLHSDTFHPSAKCWLYLDDVGPEDGPFVYTPGSHRLTWRRLKWEYRRSRLAAGMQDGHSEHGSFRAYDADIRELGLPAPRPYPVKANTLVVANTYGFHRRSIAPPGALRRAIYSFARGNPFLPAPVPAVGVGRGLLKATRRRYFAWHDRQVVAGRVPGRRVFSGPLDRRP